jgi:hypothetical protein
MTADDMQRQAATLVRSWLDRVYGNGADPVNMPLAMLRQGFEELAREIEAIPVDSSLKR